MGKLSIKSSVEVNADAAKSWEIIGPNFLNISDWGPGILKSWDNKTAQKKFQAAPAGGRYCEVVGFGKFDEKIVHYDEQKHEISWTAEGEKLPGFVSGLQNEIRVESIGKGKSRISSHLSANLSGIMGFLVGPIFKKNFRKQINSFLRSWKTYAETGEVHESKKRELAKNV